LILGETLQARFGCKDDPESLFATFLAHKEVLEGEAAGLARWRPDADEYLILRPDAWEGLGRTRGHYR
jgi:hypothetical protein